MQATPAYDALTRNAGEGEHAIARLSGYVVKPLR